MSSGFEGRVALVSGGASGIGLACARALASEGARVAIADIAGDAAERAADEVGGIFVVFDVADHGAWDAACAEVTERLGTPTLAVLSAGVLSGDGSPEDYGRVLGINVSGVVHGVRALAPGMTDGGAIVAIASLAGIVPFAPDPIYTLTKHAVVGYVRALAATLNGITVNVICPGIVDTPLVTAEVRRGLAGGGYPLIAPEAIADAAMAALAGDTSGDAYVCQPGRPPIAYAFRGVPGPADVTTPPSEEQQPWQQPSRSA